jgi:hypothetical protein
LGRGRGFAATYFSFALSQMRPAAAFRNRLFTNKTPGAVGAVKI